MEFAGPPSARIAPGPGVTRVRLRVPREHTQPPGTELVSHADLTRRLDALRRPGRVRVETIGRSHEGRAIPLVAVTGAGTPASAGAGPVPILLVGGEHGFEAAPVQALLELAEELAHDPGLEVALRSVVVLIVPLLSPDGYERSRGEWTRRPLSAGLSGDGNHYGLGVAGEYLYSEQPEAMALKSVIARWQPVLVWAAREDDAGLGGTFPEVVAVSSVDDALDGDAVAGQRREIGAAIAAAWRAEGYAVLDDPTGRPGRPSAGAELDAVLQRQGILTLVTASSRIPGSQSWHDRTRQQRVAGRVIVAESAAQHDVLRRLRADVLDAAVRDDADGFYLISGQDPAARRRAVALLSGLGVSNHQAPGDTVVVPRRQPFKTVADALLSRARGGHLCLTGGLGLTVVESAALDGTTADRWQGVRQVAGADEDGAPAFAGLDALTAVNRVLRLPGGWVGWRDDGAFLARVPAGGRRFADVVGDLDLVFDDSDACAGHPVVAELDRAPRVAVYAGQGVRDLPGVRGLGRVRWYLSANEFDATLVGPGDIAGGALDGHDVLLVPAGNAGEILRGWSDADPLRRFPWDRPTSPEGLAGAGVSAIRAFVAGGGAYVGLAAGGGSFASRDHAHLIDAGIVGASPQNHPSPLRPDASAGLLFAGLTSPVEVPHGMSFSHGPAVRRLAGYGLSNSSSAIIDAKADAGSVVLFGFDPTYRSIALRSARLLGHAILRAVTRRRTEDPTHLRRA